MNLVRTTDIKVDDVYRLSVGMNFITILITEILSGGNFNVLVLNGRSGRNNGSDISKKSQFNISWFDKDLGTKLLGTKEEFLEYLV